MQNSDVTQPNVGNQNVVWNVAEFCVRYRLDTVEENRLRKLFGDYASKQELLTNAQRKPVFR